MAADNAAESALAATLIGDHAGEACLRQGICGDAAAAVGPVVGDCSGRDGDSVFRVRKADGRWTLRQLFGSSWRDSDSDVSCCRCGRRWPAHLQGGVISLEDWLTQTREVRVAGEG